MIRDIQEQDIPELVQIGYDMAKESEYSTDGYDFDKVEDLFDRVVEQPRFYGVVSVGQSGDIRGMFVGVLNEHFFSTNTIATDLFLYVKPDYRGSRDGYALIKGYLDWCQEVQADVVKMGITTGINEEKTGELYKKLGFCYSGSIYKLRK